MSRYTGPTVREVGEAATIQAIRRAAPSELNGDDAAILRPTAPNSRHVSCTDILVLGRHFRPEYSTAYEVGVKAITQNFADIQAMGARPTAALLGLAIPGETPLSWVSELAEGIEAAAEPWAAELVGGDIVQGKELLISITALGELTGPAPALRVNRAAPGQQVIVHGKLGHSAAGLDVLRHYGSRAAIPDDEILQELASWHCAPTLVAGQGTVARAAGVASMTDNSDGLISDLNHIATSSGVTIDVEKASIAPDEMLQHAADVLQADPWKWVLSGGEDHSLLATTAARIPTGFRRIGSTGSQTGSGPKVTIDRATPAYTAGWSSL